MASTRETLFTPVKVGTAMLKHRVAMAPLTRFRAGADDHVPTDLMVEHYAQRASVPGTLLITEGVFIAQRAGGYSHVPGIWSAEQIRAWKKVTDAVHARGSFIFLQLWALGRAASADVLAREAALAGLPADAFPVVSASPIALRNRKRDDGVPRALTVAEIDEYVELYAQAAENAVQGAGFDGVEIHGANGFLPDQFLQDLSNKRTDAYGGSNAARAAFPLRVVDAVVARVGAERTGLRVSPWNEFHDMRMADPVPTFAYFAGEVRRRHPALAYLHAVEGSGAADSNDFLRDIWGRGGAECSVFLSAGGHTRESALRNAREKGDVVVFGKQFISNPDLPKRLERDLPLTPFDSSTFYAKGNPKGYVDYPFAPELVVQTEGSESRVEAHL